MTTGSHEGQLELFELGEQPVPRIRRTPVGRCLVQLRYDQLVLGVMAAVMGITVVFACGVERGKRLVRSERMLLAREQVAEPPTAKAKSKPAPVSAPTKIKPRTRVVDGSEAPVIGSTTPAGSATAGSVATAASLPPAPRERIGRYAVQVVTYSRPHLAKRELDRLQASGERAFLVMRNGRTVVYVGPFPSQGNAREKSANLKGRYADCFVKSL